MTILLIESHGQLRVVMVTYDDRVRVFIMFIEGGRRQSNRPEIGL